jgi:hypothetical protein
MEKTDLNTTPSKTGVITLVAAVLALVVTTVIITPSAAYADDFKVKSYASENGGGATIECPKKETKELLQSNCNKIFKDSFLGAPQNPAAREFCERLSGPDAECEKQKI